MSESRTNVTRRKPAAGADASSVRKAGGSGRLSAIVSIGMILAASVT